MSNNNNNPEMGKEEKKTPAEIGMWKWEILQQTYMTKTFQNIRNEIDDTVKYGNSNGIEIRGDLHT